LRLLFYYDENHNKIETPNLDTSKQDILRIYDTFLEFGCFWAAVTNISYDFKHMRDI